MATYKNGAKAETGHIVEGVDGKGQPVKGMLVMIHSHDGKGLNADAPDIAVSQNQRLIGDLHAKNFNQVVPAKPESAEPAANSPG